MARYDERQLVERAYKGVAITTLSAASAAVRALRSVKDKIRVKSLQEYHA